MSAYKTLSEQFEEQAEEYNSAKPFISEFAKLQDEIDRLRAELDRYKTSLDDAIFYGKPFAYWQELEARAKELNYDKLVDAIVTLRHRLDRYRWHPYPQEKPKDDGYYQITTTALTIYDDHYSTKIDEWETFLPVAYRPMPEAYKPEEKE